MQVRRGCGGLVTTMRVMPRDPLPPVTPDPVIEFYKKDVDRTLLRENLKLTVTQRFEKLMALQRFAEEMRRAGREARWQAQPKP
jgi:hypothetical protein